MVQQNISVRLLLSLHLYSKTYSRIKLLNLPLISDNVGLICFPVVSLRLHHTRGRTLERRNCWESVNVWVHLVSHPMTTILRLACSSFKPVTVSFTVKTEATMASSWVHYCCFHDFGSIRFSGQIRLEQGKGLQDKNK